MHQFVLVRFRGSAAPVSCLPATAASICWFGHFFLTLGKLLIFWFERQEEEWKWWRWWTESLLETAIPKLRPMGTIWFTWRGKWAFVFVFAKALFSPCWIFLEFSESLAKGLSSYSAIVAHPAGKRSAIFISLFFFGILQTMVFKASTVDSFTFKRIVVVQCFFSEVTCIFDWFDFALLQIFYRNTRTSSLSYQQVTNLPHLGVSFWG